jgi:DNA-binding NtrC family response regulator
LESIEPQRNSSQPSRIIVLNDDIEFVENLSRVLERDMPQLTIATCVSPGRAQLLLSTSQYHAVISSPSLTVVDGSSLLTRSRLARPSVPFLLTLRPDERRFGQSWIDFGVYDVIFSPLEPAQALESVQGAISLSQRRAVIANKEKALADLRERRERYRSTARDTPVRRRVDALLKESILRIQEATGYLRKSVQQMERSLEILQHSCRDNELHARQRAISRLGADLPP